MFTIIVNVLLTANNVQFSVYIQRFMLVFHSFCVITGMTGSLLLFDKVIPAMSGKSTIPKHPNSNGPKKKKMN